jgi:hypothetical protein
MPSTQNRSRSPKRHVEPTYSLALRNRPPPLDIISYSVSFVRPLPSNAKKSPVTFVRHGNHEGSAFPIGIKEAFVVHR